MFPEINNTSEMRNIIVSVSGIPQIIKSNSLHPFSNSDLTVQVQVLSVFIRGILGMTVVFQRDQTAAYLLTKK